MDEQLKRRLVGAAVISGLAVLIVPQFFEDKSPTDSAGLPQPLALPRQTGAAAPEADPQSASRETTEATARKRKYEVVPLDDVPAATPQSAPATRDASVAATPSTAAAPEATVETPAYRDEDAEAPAPLIKPRAASSRSAKSKPVASRPPAENASAPTPVRKARPPAAETPVPPVATKPKASPKPARTEASASPRPAKSGKTAKPITEVNSPRTSESAPPKPAPTVKKEAEKPAKKTAAAAPIKPAATKSAKGASWTVQAGTFADEANAKKLADKLKKSGLPVKIHPAEGSSGKVYRVTVGSSLDRSRAEKVQKNLSSQHGVKGMMLENR